MQTARCHASFSRVLLYSSIVLALTGAAFAQTDAAALRARAREVLEPLPDKMPGSENDTRALTKLGKKLYFDKRLSADKSISCNTCHQLNAPGAVYFGGPLRGASGKPIQRNSPTVLNAGFSGSQHWDGRLADLETQAREPLLNPDEMGMPPQAEMIARLRRVWLYRMRFAKSFPEASDPITIENMAKAIAAYERTLVTHDRFDDFLNGSNRALSRSERRGLQTFLDVGCQKCHSGPGLGGSDFEKMGVVHPYSDTEDLGRALVTKDEQDRYKFKVASLRNVAMTAPYFHDGGAATLQSAIRQMAHLQLGKQLSRVEVESIEAFLRALSDKRLAVKRPAVPPSLQQEYPIHSLRAGAGQRPAQPAAKTPGRDVSQGPDDRS